MVAALATKTSKEKVMTIDTMLALDKVRVKLQECRNIIDNRLYRSGDPTPEKEYEYCRKVYDAVCKAMDLL